VELQLRLELVNHSDDLLYVQVLGLESALSEAHGPQSPSAAIALSPQGSKTVTQDFTVSRVEFDRWQADSRRRLAH
jgi:hypothetical protein